MTLGKIFGILMFSSLVAIGATLAEDISKNLTNPKNLANSEQVANVKGDKVPPKRAAASVVVHPRRARSADRHGAQRQLASQNQAASRESEAARFERKFNFGGRFAINPVKTE